MTIYLGMTFYWGMAFHWGMANSGSLSPFGACHLLEQLQSEGRVLQLQPEGQVLQLHPQELIPFFLFFTILTISPVTMAARIILTMIVPMLSVNHVILQQPFFQTSLLLCTA